MGSPARPKVGFVLSGGGSRGAYEAGVIQYLRTDLARRLGRHVPIDIVTGTSVGAINAAFLAATMDDPASQARRLTDAWRALRVEELIGLGLRDAWRAMVQLLGREPPPPAPGAYRYGGLLETGGLERFVVKHIPWSAIDRNLRSGALRALSVSATHVGTGHTVVFVHSAAGVPHGWSKDPFVRHQEARIGPRHVLASAAIPLLFPSVKVGDSFYTDGGLRQNTPMSPAIRLGADKMLMISLRHIDARAQPTPALADGYPRPLFLLGKALNALMLDHTEYDLDRMRRLNALLAAGTSVFGPDFVPKMNAELVKLRGAPIRPIEALHIRPSADIGVMASDFLRTGKLLVSSPVTRRLIERMAAGESRQENDLLSYLMFDGNWATELIELGHKDAAAKEEELARFFDSP
ncbi:MAG: patatin-like phospholipase family protein [Kofleriaceae bacterium]|nr:patatin-like phospholipase family protein [Kofleriaceae bacterium]MBP9167919.1 patatin-like phospholipase family protein [Kofleriaceae bacterium]MBP9856753.1 patatin-like phospholipase family protein [Kofleriaceae bacterium]